MEPVAGQLATIRELCDREGALMIADETITGFRFGPGGAQGYYGVTPDLTVFGKAIGGGVPFAALAGRAQFFEPIVRGEVVHAGTLNANPLCLAASRWCLDEIRALGAGHPAGLQRLGFRLMSGLEKLAGENGIPLQPQGPALVFHTAILRPGVESGPMRDYRDYVQRHDPARWAHLRRCLLEEGVRAIERGLWFISLAHSESDIDETLRRAGIAMRRHAGEWKE
jgi:glutamate-1-semialdehyde 2,1-aminomutase